jgi:extracellular factor (EF) 3-hydroxypalmitic acid methyl ester biosynthesis protein
VREGLEAEMFPLLDAQFERFEAAAGRIPPDLQPIHAKYARRLLHPVVLGAPFAFRCIQKPLGYAGDYEVVNMILRHAPEGNSLYHRLLNRWFTSQAPAVAHRNRIAFLVQRLVAETLRVRRQKRPIRIFNLGCGPAGEIQEFLSTHELSDAAHFDLLDFNQETLDHTRAVLSALQQERGRQTQIEFSKKSVAQYLKAQAKAETAAAAGTYDLAYCAGLFDYLPDSVCKQLIESMYAKLAPGGLLLATNVDPSNPIRNWLGLILEWHLIYRDGHQMRALAPAGAVPEQVQISSDLSGVNVFLEVRKPVA